MAKKGVYKISGNTKPTVGKKEFYIVDQWYPATPLSDRNLAKVTWELFIKTDNGFRSTNVKKKGINHFTFGKNAYKYVYKIEGYLHEPEGNSPMSLIVYPQKNEEKKIVTEKNIKNVVLTYENGSTINKTLSYRDRLQATAICEGLEGEKIVFKLWEDDEAKNGHNNKNQFITKSPPVEVNKFGKAKWSFSLNSTFISLANKREDDKSKHEYYVTAEFSGKILEDSQNVNVTNPEYKIEQPQQLPQRPKRHPRGNSSPKPKQESPKASTRPGSPNNQPDKKGKISSIKLVDIHGKQFSKNPKFGDIIKLIIEGKDVVGQPYRLKLWEHDNTGEDDLLYNQEHTFKSDKQEVYIRLLDEYRTIGEIGNNSKKPDSGEYWTGNHQEIFAEVIFLGIKSESQRIDIDLKEEPKKEIQHVSPAKVEKTEISKANTSCVCKQYDLIWGEKVSCDFRKKVVEISKDLWPNHWLEMANNLMAVFAWETGETFKPDVPNKKKSGATGLIQFMPERADEYFGKHTIEIVPNYFNSSNRNLHYLPRVKEFAQMSAVTQLGYVKKYFKNLKGKKLDFVDFYLQVLFPVSSGKPEHYVFGTERNRHLIGLPSDTPEIRQKRIDKYEKNSGMDTISDGKISKSEIASSVSNYKTNGLKYKKITECKNEIPKQKLITGGCFKNIVKDGFLIDSKIEILRKGTTPKINKDVKIIVLHRTHYNLKHDVKNLIINNKYPVHFWVNGDGKIYQQTSLENVSYHIGVAQKAHTIANKWGNNNSISIEVNGEYLDKNGNRANNEVVGGYWEPVTNEQAQSVACLVSFLMEHFSLSKSDIKVHEELCAKTKGEGKTVYNAMLPLLK